MLTRRLAVTVSLLLIGFASSQAWGQITGAGIAGGGAGGGGTRGQGGQGAVQGAPGSLLQQNLSEAGVTGNERFIRENRTADMFVGAAADVGFVGATQGGTTAGQQRAPDRARGQQNRGQTNRGTPARRINYRTKVTIGFRITPPSPSQTEAALQRLISRIQAVEPLSPLRVSVNDDTAVLSGVVKSEEARGLAARLVRLEPGIATVQNQLTVAASASE